MSRHDVYKGIAKVGEKKKESPKKWRAFHLFLGERQLE